MNNKNIIHILFYNLQSCKATVKDKAVHFVCALSFYYVLFRSESFEYIRVHV